MVAWAFSESNSFFLGIAQCTGGIQVNKLLSVFLLLIHLLLQGISAKNSRSVKEKLFFLLFGMILFLQDT